MSESKRKRLHYFSIELMVNAAEHRPAKAEMLLDNGKQGLYEGKKQEDSGCNDRNKCPWVFEIITHQHCSIFWPTVLTIFVHFCSQIRIEKLFYESVVVELIEELRSIVDIQPVVNDPTLAKYLNVFGSVDEVVQ